jgi:aerotaxis receptor
MRYGKSASPNGFGGVLWVLQRFLARRRPHRSAIGAARWRTSLEAHFGSGRRTFRAGRNRVAAGARAGGRQISLALRVQSGPQEPKSGTETHPCGGASPRRPQPNIRITTVRTNLPVTQREYELEDGVTLMSTTDTKGRITYCNAAFIQVSGYERDELMGKPHNLIRHPDMPAAGFADLWATIQAGQTWTALVKNRRKNGDHYWVRANVTPMTNNGRVTGYMSVRTKPGRDEVAQSEALYGAVREGQSRNLRLYKGIVVRTGPLAWLTLLRRISVRWRIGAAVAACALGAVAAAAVLGLGGAALAAHAAVMLVLGLLVTLWLQAQIAAPLALILEQAMAVAAGGPAANIHLNRTDEIGLILRSVNQSGLNLRSLIDDVGVQVEGLKTASREFAQGSSDLSSRTEQTAASLQQTAASMEQMTATLSQSAEGAQQATALAGQASAAAARGGQAVGQVAGTMQQISSSSRRIGDIIAVIDGIAFQTNILALNAAVEAARAGEQGRGFAVVASEVRSLAQRSAGAAREIKALIARSVESVEHGAAQVDDAGHTMEDIVTQVRRVCDLIREISSSTAEQSSGIKQVNAAVSELDRMTQQNAALVEQSSAAAESLRDQAHRLSEVVDVYRSVE